MFIKKLFTDHSIRFLKIGKISLLCFGLLNLFACSSDDDDLIGNWVAAYDVEGSTRSLAVGVALDNMGYYGLGWNGEDRKKDFWQYDPNANTYKKLTDFPGVARTAAVTFACAGKIYVGTGDDGTVQLKDFYEYDPSTNSWQQIADFPGAVRREATAFSVGGKGYVGQGYNKDDGYFKDFYSYDPATGEWAAVASFGGYTRAQAVAFVIDDVPYVCTGKNSNYLSDFWKYDVSSGTWVQLRNIADTNDDESYDDDYDIVRADAVAFVANGKGYVCTGGRGSAGRDTWEYDPTTDLWDEKTGFEGASRQNAVAFTLNDKGYVLTGNSGSYYTSDIWYFQPDAEQDDDDNGGSY